ncbi:hypothetical protein ACBJ59_22850 [Nonomuraea sp. MTCD27]|uniref:hypothetical protein n=1 Tax=Nonomuraea sp. MTCD27 TaxID=1676747 RepID=UPI0035C01423
MVRLAFGVVTGRDQDVWDARGHLVTGESPEGGPKIDAESRTRNRAGSGAEADPVAGAPVAVGPAGADPAPALAALTRLLATGPPAAHPGAEEGGDGVTAAGAGVELCPGFVSARLDGVRGDRRDAVLAAVSVLGPDGLHRLGERAGVLVALFGAEATKPVAAAANRAIAEGRWAALQLASAASGVLGAEQLERLLHLGAPAVASTLRAAASTMAGHLERVLEPLPPRRRLDLLLDLWDQVAAQQERARRKERLRATQGKQSRLEELTTRYRAHDDELLIHQIRTELGHEPSLVEAARWRPGSWQWTVFMGRTMADAMAATVLLRTAVAVADHGVQEGIARCATQLTAAARLMGSWEAGRAARRVPGLAGLPARPGCYVRDLAARLKAPSEPYVMQRLARAAEYARIVMEAVTERLDEAGEQLHGWSMSALREWRAAVGYDARRDPAGWDQTPLGGGRGSLATRSAARAGVPVEEEERVGDLLWYAELADALAQLNGHDRADIRYGPTFPYADPDPDPDDGEQLVPPLDSIPSALAGAAQLVAFGGRPARKSRTWRELTAGLVAELEVAQALTAAFRLPEPLAERDGTILPGTRVRLECARDARMLARWSSYMGNCIASPWYVEAAEQGRCALLALRDDSGRIVANVELQHRARGWRLAEIRARFNADPDRELETRVASWVAALPAPAATEPPARERPEATRPAPRRPANRAFQEVSGPLTELARRAMEAPDTLAALHTLRSLYDARGGGAADAPDEETITATGPAGPASPAATTPRIRPPAATPRGRPGLLTADTARSHPLPGSQTHAGHPGTEVLTALRRLSADRMESVCRAGLPAAGLVALWQATGVRPLERALAALDPGLRARHDQLGLLAADEPLPGSLRGLARHGAIAPARSMELVARRIRAALGRLARASDPMLAHQVARHADTAVLCSLVVAITSWPPEPGFPSVAVSEPGETAVPGFPRTSLEDPDGPWQRALTGAAELGAGVEAFRERVAADGLRVPAAWLGNGGWPALWQRAAR